MNTVGGLPVAKLSPGLCSSDGRANRLVELSVYVLISTSFYLGGSEGRLAEQRLFWRWTGTVS
jgi:hypothetical protein